jgi:hypothetical protein
VVPPGVPPAHDRDRARRGALPPARHRPQHASLAMQEVGCQLAGVAKNPTDVIGVSLEAVARVNRVAASTVLEATAI